MKKYLILMFLLLTSFTLVMAQQAADPRGDFSGPTVTGENLQINFQALIPDFEYVPSKRETVPPVGLFNYKFKDDFITEKSINLIKNWRKESK